MWLLREAEVAPLAETTTDHHAIVMQDVNNGHAIVTEGARVARLLLVNRHRVPNSLRANEPIVMKWTHARPPFCVKKPLRPMAFLLKEGRTEVRDAEANRVVMPRVRSVVMPRVRSVVMPRASEVRPRASEVRHHDRIGDLLKRLLEMKLARHDHCLLKQLRLVLTRGSQQAWMTNPNHVAAPHLP